MRVRSQRLRLRRRTALVAMLVATFAGSLLTVAPPAPATAAAQDDDFVVVYFPHRDPLADFHNDWGAGRSGGRRHQGTDIFSDKLTPVVAVADGFVVAIRDGARSGWYVRLEHAAGYETYYMHLNNDSPGTDDGADHQGLAVPGDLAVGDYVAAGDVIGYVGDSGNAEGAHPHTHFEIHRDGRARNPFPYLADAWDRAQRRLALRRFGIR